jgi:hypothetical protein
MASLPLATGFVAACSRSEGLFDRRFGDWRIYVYGAIGGIGFGFVSEWSRVRCFAQRLVKTS